MSTYVDKPFSLIDKKKEQWAKEREELAAFCAPWSATAAPTTTNSQPFERPFQRNRYVSKLSMANNSEFFRTNNNTNPNNKDRRPSLPPLYKNQYNSMDRGGETSGYASDANNPHPSGQTQIFENIPPIISTAYPSEACHNNNHYQSGYESSSSRDDRLKWRDRERDKAGNGSRGSINQNARYNGWEQEDDHDPPSWVKRGLRNDGVEEIVVSNTSPAESPQDDGMERPYTGSTNSVVNNRSYIRGQNVPLDSSELAERERRRQIALEHQEAVRQQLEEREKKRRQEREQRIREELEEELRIEREQEQERLRKEHELKIQREKQERERKRKEALQQALELAEKEAKRIKQQKREHDIIIYNNDLAGDDNKDVVVNLNNGEVKIDNSNNNTNTPCPSNVEKESTETINSSCVNDNTANSPKINYQIITTPRNDTGALLVPQQIENNLLSASNVQYAVLMQPLTGQIAPQIAIPITPIITPRTENRILTPTQYRNRNNNKRLCDSSTQTDDYLILNLSSLSSTSRSESENNQVKYVKEKLTNLELNNNNLNRNNALKVSTRAKSDDRTSGGVEERPKWGANRPPTRYMKQSEKDLLYQRRNKYHHSNQSREHQVRLKRRSNSSYKNNRQSSDDSPPASPRHSPAYSRYKNHHRALWRQNDHFFASRNIRLYQTEMVPLESDREQIYYSVESSARSRRNSSSSTACGCCCRCRCRTGSGGGHKGRRRKHLEGREETSTPVSADVLKIEHSPRDSEGVVLPQCGGENNNVDSGYIMDKLASLHDGLMMKQEQWERIPRTPSLSSPGSNAKNNLAEKG